jgi:hypothetical protein
MSNERLRLAMSNAHVDIGALAAAAQVDPKTVQRWLAGRVPHPRHRWVVADLLHTREEALWPREATGVGAGGSAAEVVGVYARRAEVPRELWSRLLEEATHRVDLLAYAMLFLPEQHPHFVDTLREKAARNCPVRIALADPDSEQVRLRDAEERLGGTLAPRIRTTLRLLDGLLGWPGVEVRFHSAPLYNSVFRYDNDMVVTPHLYATHGFNAPVLHLRRLSGGDLFDTYADSFDRVVAGSVPVWPAAVAA